ncbi:hypothetical protein D9756_006685 [Leucocoprinus leucothites]|uniref:Uncharacterized protein n=1 Tax=Leucocoprinus leucothites TaxID=201217 RepID=A0A8H5G1Q1_9AGAR|nr:hypothetical protein D9756_006685 [Leucoagaricus leucothites]
MRRATILFAVAATITASPTLPLDDPQDTKRHFHRRNGLPPISQVMMALEMQSIASKSLSTSTVATSSTSHIFPSLMSAYLPAATLPYSGPGILILPESSSSSQGTTPTPTSNATATSMQANSSQDPSHMSPTMRHLAVFGGAFAIIIFLVACCFFVMDPRIWKSCAASRKDKLRLARAQRFGQRPLPSWMRITPSPASPDNSFEKKGLPMLSPYPYSLSDGLKSKFSMTTASDYSYCDDSFDTSASSPQMPTLPYNGHGRPPALSPPLPTYAASTDRVGRPATLPVRPPRPPTTDSPAMIESIYYADVDDPGFYQHPNPIVLGSASPIINNPPSTSSINPQAQAHLNLPPSHQFFSSTALGMDALQRHNRSRSVPTLDTLSTSIRRLSGASSVTQETVESVGPESECSQQTLRPHRSRASTSAVSWVRYSEFQQQHHLRLQQQQSKSSERPASGQLASFTKDRDDIGTAH